MIAMVNQIPFNKPSVSGKEFSYMRDAIQGMHISGDGPYTAKCHQFLQATLGVSRALLTTSCTHALELAALLLKIEPGDEVICPDFTFVSTINAFVLRGAKPVFVDIRPDTLNLDETLLERKITRRTKAIVPVHYAGVACEMDKILDVAARYGVAVVEDNAHGLFGKYRGRWLGTFGALATQSFHETKNIICGEGGALLINEPELIERAEILREKGTNRSQFFRGLVDKYTWVDVGSSYLPSDMLAAFLWAQLEEWQDIQRRRRKIWQGYWEGLSEWAKKTGYRLPSVPETCEHSAHMFFLLLLSLEQRTAFIRHLKERGVHAVFHYLPLHMSKMGRRFGGRAGDFPVTEDMSDRLVRLPMYTSMTPAEQEQVVDAILSFPL